ncbi:NINE protein [Rhodocaloribacter sp.]
MRSKGVAYLLWCGGLFGFAGLHRFYLGKVGTGLLWLFTLGLLGFGQLVDLFTLGNQVDMVNMKGGFVVGGAGRRVEQSQNVVVNVTAPERTYAGAAADASSSNSAEQLEKLARLLEQGHISQEEFETQKSRLLTS